MTKYIPVDPNRIKTISASVRIEKDYDYESEFHTKYLIDEISRGIASKLVEFGKVKKVDYDSYTLNYIEFDVIVPKGPPE